MIFIFFYAILGVKIHRKGAVDIKRITKKHEILNWGICILIAILWLGCIWVHGLFGAVSWAILKLIMPILGFLGMVVFGILIIIRITKKRKIRNYSITFLLSVLLAFPILITMNILPLAYPIHSNQTSPTLTIISPLTEDAVIGWGGDSIETNLPHVMWASER